MFRFSFSSNHLSPFLAGTRRLAVGVRSAAVALCAHAILAVAVACKQRLRGAFRAVVANDPVFSGAVDADDTRHALDEVAEYDAFRDEGVDGLLKLSARRPHCVHISRQVLACSLSRHRLQVAL